jgi:hypothetical protein
MSSLSDRPPGANADHPSTDPPSLDWDDPTATRAWLRHVREHALDAVAAGDDITRPAKTKRVRSRGEARSMIRAAGQTLAALLDFAERGLPPPPPLPPS